VFSFAGSDWYSRSKPVFDDEQVPLLSMDDLWNRRKTRPSDRN
jgi:hypothetical protein